MGLEAAVDNVLALIGLAMGIIGIATGLTTAIVYVRVKSNIDSLEATVGTYKELFEAQDKKIDVLTEDNKTLRTCVEGLEGERRGMDKAVEFMVMQLMLGVANSGVCRKAFSCKDRDIPEVPLDGTGVNLK